MMMQHGIQAIIFDMDGVIADSEPLHFEAEKTILQQRGIEAPWDEWHKFTGLTDDKIFQYLVDNFTDGRYSPEELMEAKYGIFITLLRDKLQLIPGVLEFICWARDHYPKLALTTSSTQRVQQTVFNKFELNSYFDVIVTGDHIQHGKPHPEPYLTTVNALDVPADACMVVEDSLSGVQSAKAAGCTVTGITTSFLRQQLFEAGADFVIDDFASLYHDRE